MICDKVPYQEHKDAKKHLIHLNSRKDGHKYRLYKCEHCGFFHVTTATKYLRKDAKKGDLKYPIKIEPAKKELSVPAMKPIVGISSGKVERPLTTSKVISKDQALFLKQLINTNNEETTT